MQLKSININQLWNEVFHPTATERQQWDWTFVVRIGFLTVFYTLANLMFRLVFKPSFESYEEPFISWALLKHLLSEPLSLVLLPLIASLFFFRKRTVAKWSIFPKYRALRLFVTLAAFILTWVYSTYDLNLYANQWHYADRSLLLAFLLLIWWRPVFVWPFLMLLFPVIEQLTVLNGFSWVIPYVPFQILVLFAVYFLLYVLTNSKQGRDFVFMAALIYVTHYWNSGIYKLNLFWVFNDHIHFLIPNTYANGWLGFLPPEKMAAFANTLAPLNIVFRPLVIFLETGSMFLLFHRQLPKMFLIGFIGFHTGVFIYWGVCFWVWVTMDLGLLLLLTNKNAFAHIFKFEPVHLALFIFLLCFNRFWQKTQPLFWFDVPLTYTYIFEAKTDDGNVHRLPPNFFAPFDYQFTHGNFGCLNENKILPIVWGASSEAYARWFLEKRSYEEILEREKGQGIINYDKERSAAFEHFLRQYVKNWNGCLVKNNWLTALQPPRYLWTFLKDPFPEGAKRIQEVTVYELTTLYQEGKYKELRKRPLRKIEID